MESEENRGTLLFLSAPLLLLSSSPPLLDYTRFVGQFQDDEMLRGKYTYPDGRAYDGDFHEGHKHGKGKFTWPDGDWSFSLLLFILLSPLFSPPPPPSPSI